MAGRAGASGGCSPPSTCKPSPADYDAWYDTRRGRWIGGREFAQLMRLLDARAGETLLDIGCGTGYFSRRFAREAGLTVTASDIAAAPLRFARDKSPDIAFVRSDAACLPFADGSFDHVVAITSLCFVADQRRVLAEMARVARRTVALGLLNRHSLLYWQKRGRNGGYAGAHWHSRAEARALLGSVGAGRIRTADAIFVPTGGRLARALEARLSPALPFGGFLAIVGEPPAVCRRTSQECRSG